MKKAKVLFVVIILLFSSVVLAGFLDLGSSGNPNNVITGYQVLNPDLYIKSITASGSLPSGSSIRFTGYIQEINEVSVNNVFGTSFRLDLNSNTYNTEDVFLGAPPTEGSQLPLAAGATTTEQSDAWTVTVGTHTLRVCTDWINQVAESNEANNCKDFTLTVFPSSTTTSSSTTTTSSTSSSTTTTTTLPLTTTTSSTTST